MEVYHVLLSTNMNKVSTLNLVSNFAKDEKAGRGAKAKFMMCTERKEKERKSERANYSILDPLIHLDLLLHVILMVQLTK